MPTDNRTTSLSVQVTNPKRHSTLELHFPPGVDTLPLTATIAGKKETLLAHLTYLGDGQYQVSLIAEKPAVLPLTPVLETPPPAAVEVAPAPPVEAVPTLPVETPVALEQSATPEAPPVETPKPAESSKPQNYGRRR